MTTRTKDEILKSKRTSTASSGSTPSQIKLMAKLPTSSMAMATGCLDMQRNERRSIISVKNQVSI